MGRRLARIFILPLFEYPGPMVILGWVVVGLTLLRSIQTDIERLNDVAGQQRDAARDQVAATSELRAATDSVRLAVNRMDDHTARLMRWSIAVAVLAALAGAVVGALLAKL